MTETRGGREQGASPGQGASQGNRQEGHHRPTDGNATGTALLESEMGQTEIADSVVAKIAGMAAREVSGVHDFGLSTARAFGAIKGRLGGGDGVTRGIAVEVGQRQAAVDVDLVVEYGVAIPDLANAVRRNVIGAVERMCGLQVTEVNVTVDDVHLPSQDGGEQQQRTTNGPSRVQ